MFDRSIDDELYFEPNMENLKSFCKVVNLNWDPSEEELLQKFSSIIMLMKEYINADAVEFFIVENEQIVRVQDVNVEKPIKGSSAYSIESGEIIAAHAANNKKPITVSGYIYNKNQNKSKFPRGIGRGDKIPDQVLSLPVVSANDNCLAVFDFYRFRSYPFQNVEISMAKCMAGWLGRSIRKRPREEISENAALRSWSEDLKSYQAGDILLEHFVSRALVSIDEPRLLSFISGDDLRTLQVITDAEVINFYKIEQQKFKMYGQVKFGVFLEKKREILVESNTFLETIVKHHRPIHVRENDMEKFRTSNKESLKNNQDILIRNYLCVPVGIPATTTGIVELINKSKGNEFDEKDIEFAVHCGRICSAAITLEKNRNEKRQLFHMAKSQSAAIMRNMAACPHRFDNFYKKLKETSIPDNFYSFDFYPHLEDLKHLEQFSYFIFKEVFHLDDDPHDKISLRFIDFIITMEKGYRPNPYHNFEHGFNVCHTMFLITRKNRSIFSDKEIQALLVAALGHDVDHPGFTNNWIAKSENPLIQCYENAYLENHHSNLCRLAAQNSGIFSDLSSKDYKETMDLIHMLIIQTDRVTSLENRFKIAHLVDTKEFLITDEIHRKYLLGLMIASSDIGGQAKPFDVNSRLCRNIYKEFESERKKCLAMGFDPPWLKRTCPKNMPELQITFNIEVSMPCFKILDQLLHGLSPLYNNCRELNKVWQSICREGIQCVEFEELIYKCEEP